MTQPVVIARVAAALDSNSNVAAVHRSAFDNVCRCSECEAYAALRKPVTPEEVEEVATWLAGVAQHDILEDRILWEYAARALLTALGLSVARAKGERRVA